MSHHQQAESPEEQRRNLGMLQQAVEQSRIVAFNYRSRHKGGFGWHKVEPQDLYQSRESWFLLGYDLRVKDWRTFRVDRMSQMTIYRHRFAPREVFDLTGQSDEEISLSYETHAHPDDVPRQGEPLAYLDIEASLEGAMTVLGVYRSDRGTIQLVGEAITPEAVAGALAGVAHIYTYSGHNFDIPLVQAMGIDMPPHTDLLFECHMRGLRGGMKKVEEMLGIPRELPELNGSHATMLWRAFERDRRWAALRLLMAYNYEDTVNLARLRHRLLLLPITEEIVIPKPRPYPPEPEEPLPPLLDAEGNVIPETGRRRRRRRRRPEDGTPSEMGPGGDAT